MPWEENYSEFIKNEIRVALQLRREQADAHARQIEQAVSDLNFKRIDNKDIVTGPNPKFPHHVLLQKDVFGISSWSEQQSNSLVSAIDHFRQTEPPVGTWICFSTKSKQQTRSAELFGKVDIYLGFSREVDAVRFVLQRSEPIG